MLSLSDPIVATCFEAAGANYWRCKQTGCYIGGSILNFYCQFGGLGMSGLTHLGLPITNVYTPRTGYPGSYQWFQRGILAYDPLRQFDQPPGSGDVYFMRLPNPPRQSSGPIPMPPQAPAPPNPPQVPTPAPPQPTPTPPQGPTSGTGNHFYAGQCTFWAAERFHQLFGVWVPWLGNAWEWAGQAQSAGWVVSPTPTAGSIMVLQPNVQGAGSLGHVAIVETIVSSMVVSTSNYSWYANGGGWGVLSYWNFQYPANGMVFLSLS
ncbi:CHAP domain-containing protein [Ktedonospora formicarum]|uniref:Peptidase C51 domain-containing protein n=1 Tax=Ktedonospora formicarum TaxID=2778364 RepID=A0A8J3I323_9CHLR|nr:CHAP domain-containing protein [Ktedonospora formicarum]GHO46681.1 hypothetical protein KSX_48440 [Ktedonospora formicarum]